MKIHNTPVQRGPEDGGQESQNNQAQQGQSANKLRIEVLKHGNEDMVPVLYDRAAMLRVAQQVIDTILIAPEYPELVIQPNPEDEGKPYVLAA
jgi:hypothetical protein